MRKSTVRKRLLAIILIAIPLGIATALVLLAMQDNIMFFRTPSQVAEQNIPPNTVFRLGGLVATGSVISSPDKLITAFTVTDGAGHIPVQYKGILPNLFREGQGVVAEGALNEDGLFIAQSLLAKHDENYMPPPLKKAAEESHYEAVNP